ncbi:lysozyme inhibitor LprI family protein [Microbacteriaceae bacterium K1510]|nr:lysozyme inhibitor LprI family protein [Microbacteriaceae bacterium K1510]
MPALRIAAFVTAALLGAAVSAYAEDKGEPDQQCGVSTPEMVECLNAQAAAWDKRLNAAYKSALDAAQSKQREQLRTAQRLWLQYRDANCTYYFMGEGSIARVEAADCTRRMTKARALELEGKDEGN